MTETPNRAMLNAIAEREAGAGKRFDIAERCREVKVSRYDP